jgi:hypothetical protein
MVSETTSRTNHDVGNAGSLPGSAKWTSNSRLVRVFRAFDLKRVSSTLRATACTWEACQYGRPGTVGIR